MTAQHTATATSTAGSDTSLGGRAIDTGWVQQWGRIGWVAKGVVYVLLGVLALQIVVDDLGGTGDGGSEQASRTGALAEIAESTWGTSLLAVVGAGLALYALWRLTTAVMPGADDAETWAHRAAYLGSAILYGFLAWSALSFALTDAEPSGGSGGSGDSVLESVSRSLLGDTLGRWLLGLGAVAALGVAGYLVYRGVSRTFLERVDLAGADRRTRRLIEYTGVLGWIGRALVVGLLAVFVLFAAWTADASEARGLDGALREVADDSLGRWLVIAVAVGLVAYGVFAVVSARRRILAGP